MYYCRQNTHINDSNQYELVFVVATTTTSHLHHPPLPQLPHHVYFPHKEVNPTHAAQQPYLYDCSGGEEVVPG